MEESEEEHRANGRLTVADRVARAAVYGYAADVISAALYAYAVLPRRWRKLVELVRKQQALERDAWVKMERTRKRLARSRVASALQRLYRRKKSEERQHRETVRKFMLRCVNDRRRRRCQAARLWWRHAVMSVCSSRRSSAMVLQRWWCTCLARQRFLALKVAAKAVQAAWRAHLHSRMRAEQLMKATNLIAKWMTARVRNLKLKSSIKKRGEQGAHETRRRLAIVKRGASRLWAIWRRHRAMMAIVACDEGRKKVEMSVFEDELTGNQTEEQQEDADDQDELCRQRKEIAKTSALRIVRFCRRHLVIMAEKRAQRPEVDDVHDAVFAPSETVVRFGRVPIRPPRRVESGASAGGVTASPPPKRQSMRRRSSERGIASDASGVRMTTRPTTRPIARAARSRLPPLVKSLVSSAAGCAELGRHDDLNIAVRQPRLIADWPVGLLVRESPSRVTAAALATGTARTPLRTTLTDDDSDPPRLPSLATKPPQLTHGKGALNPSRVRLPSLNHQVRSNQDGDR